MKIGIITLVGSDNCGSLLQTYALQKYLEKNYDCDVEVINYCDPVTSKTYGIFAPSILMRPVQLFRTIQHYRRLRRQKKDYEKFRKRYIHLTPKKYYTIRDLKKETWNYDIVISGSDQVWNWPEAYIDETYFLDWLDDDTRKIGYAPSTGGSINPDDALTVWVKENYTDLRKIHDCLARYHMISVREESGRQYLERLLGTSIQVVADPTLMLDLKDWIDITPERNVLEDYIFYYSFGYKNEELNILVKRASEKLGLPVYVINASLWNHKNENKYNFRIHQDGGPLSYLSLMKNAEYVFAESFHGCISAFLFKKNFWFLNNHTDGRIEARIQSLLECLCLTDRELNTVNFNMVDLKKSIDYNADFHRLNAIKRKSEEFLNKAISTNTNLNYHTKALEYRIAMQTNWAFLSDEKIRQRFIKIKPLAEKFISFCQDKTFEQYFHVKKDKFMEMDDKEYLTQLKNSTWYKEKKLYIRLQRRLGYPGHLLYRTYQKFQESGFKGVCKAVLVKYKWWFRIGY